MGYNFKLDALRRYRQFEEDQLQKELSEAMRLLEQCEANLAECIAKRSRCEKAFQEGSNGSESAPQAAMYRGFLQSLSADINALRIHAQSAQKNCENAREALLNAMQKRKTLDRLKEKGEQSFLMDMDSAEQKFINEMAISRFTLKKSQ